MKIQGISEYIDRPMDIDILFFNNESIVEENICIPHPLLHLRNFCIQPLCDIQPDYVHPVLGIRMKEISDHFVSESEPFCYLDRIKISKILEKNLNDTL